MKRLLSVIGILLIEALLHVGCSHTPPPPRAPLDLSQTALTPEQIQEKARQQQVAQRRKKARQLFKHAYGLYEAQSYRDACIALHQYLSTYTPDDEDYDWAEFFFGLGLKRLGFSHAAIDTLADLVIRKPNPKIVSYAMELFEKASRNGSFDRDLVIKQVVCGHEYGFVGPEMNDFISYYQGVFDWEHGFNQWGEDHFHHIQRGSYYDYKYLYEKALFSIYHGQVDDAIGSLKAILDEGCQDQPLKDDAVKTLARLYYEKQQFETADWMYHSVKKPILEQGHNLLERAWTQFRMGHAERAMGLLYAYEAPSFQQYFTPEYYILKSFIYKDVCHYEKALNVVNDFRERYGEALRSIYERRPALDNQSLLMIILNKDKVRERWDFISLLEAERKQCETLTDKDLVTYLHTLYDLKIKEKVRELTQIVKAEYEQWADQLLRYEEEAHLMEYEIGLDMYKRVSQYHFDSETKKDQPQPENQVVYPFQGEFWNDELADYKVVLPDKCKTMEEWDIFFK